MSAALKITEEAKRRRKPGSAKFRTLMIDGRRRAFALEPVFWRILEDAAGGSGMRLSHYLARVLAEDHDDNDASLLRSHAADFVRGRADHLASFDLAAVARRSIRMVTKPAFVIDEKRAIAASNQGFFDLQKNKGEGVPAAENPTVRIRFSANLASVTELLRENNAKVLPP